MPWVPSLTQTGLLLDLVAAWILFSDKLGYETLDRLDHRLERVAEEGALRDLIRREWLLEPGNRLTTLARHLLVLLTFALVATLVAQKGIVGATALLGLGDFMGSIAGAWSTTSDLVHPLVFGVSLLVLAAVLGLAMIDLEDITRRHTVILVVLGLASALPVLAVMWVVLIPLSVLYALVVPLTPFVQWLPLTPLHVGRWVKNHGGPNRVMPGAGMALLSVGFGLQFVATF